jgi:hypothetical protein
MRNRLVGAVAAAVVASVVLLTTASPAAADPPPGQCEVRNQFPNWLQGKCNISGLYRVEGYCTGPISPYVMFVTGEWVNFPSLSIYVCPRGFNRSSQWMNTNDPR